MSGLSRTRDNAPSKICIIRHSNFFYFFCKADSSHQSSEFRTYFLCKIKKNQNVDYYSFVKTSQAYKSCRMSRLIFCQKKKKKKKNFICYKFGLALYESISFVFNRQHIKTRKWYNNIYIWYKNIYAHIFWRILLLHMSIRWFICLLLYLLLHQLMDFIQIFLLYIFLMCLGQARVQWFLTQIPGTQGRGWKIISKIFICYSQTIECISTSFSFCLPWVPGMCNIMIFVPNPWGLGLGQQIKSDICLFISFSAIWGISAKCLIAFLCYYVWLGDILFFTPGICLSVSVCLSVTLMSTL